MGPKGDNFVSLSQEAKDSVGDRLRHLLDKVVGGAMVPLLNCTLSNDDVKKLSSLKFNENVGEESIPQKHEKMLLNPVKQEYDDKEDIAMANIDQDISNWRQEEGIDNMEEDKMKRKSRERSKTRSDTYRDRDSNSSNNYSKEPMFKCQKCDDYQTHRRGGLINHLANKHGMGTRFTRMTRTWEEMYKYPKMSNYDHPNNQGFANIPSIKCHKCDKTFDKKDELFWHLEAYHGRERSFDCHYCSMRTYSRSSLFRHVKSFHEDIEVHVQSNNMDKTIREVSKVIVA